MIDVWLKIRKRQNIDFILRHLNSWISVFSNKNIYRVWLYNENVVLPSYFKKFKNIIYVNKNILMENYDCRYLYSAISKSKIISEWWKPTSFALAAPYFYLNTDSYIWNIDADDLKLEGPAAFYIQKAYDFAVSNKLETFSYDMLFSYNGKNAEKRHHWTFGLNASLSNRMKEIIQTNLNNNLVKPQINVGINLDLIIDHYLNKFDNYVCFITPDKLHHMELCYTKYDKMSEKIEVSDYGNIITVPKHQKTVVLK